MSKILAIILGLILADYNLPEGCRYGIGTSCPCQSGWHWNIQNQACEKDRTS